MANTNFLHNPTFQVDKLTYEIFSILENKFLFGQQYDAVDAKLTSTNNKSTLLNCQNSLQSKITKPSNNGKVRILSIDAGGATNGILAAKSLAALESSLRRKSGNPAASVSDFFDVAAGSGSGGLLVGLLFTRGKDGRPMFSAAEALSFLISNRRSFTAKPTSSLLRRFLRSPEKLEKLLKKTFGEYTLKDTIKSVLIPCYDLSSRAPFVFSRADAVELDGYDFKMSDVCMATCADPTGMCGAVEMRSADQKNTIVGVDGGIAMNNPTAAAITHVLNNKQEFPMCSGVEDLLVVSLGNGESEFGFDDKVTRTPSRFLGIAGEGASDMVDQAVSMAFGQCRGTNYVRIQANGIITKKLGGIEKATKSPKREDVLALTEEMLSQKNVESVLFQGKKMVESTNLDKLESFAGELIKEQERRKTSILPTVMLKQASPRTSSATTLSTLSSC